MKFGDSLNASVTRNAQKTAIVLGHERLSYEQLKHSSESLALWLLEHGCRPGDRIALHWPNSIDMVKLLFACFKAGMIAVPVNVRLKAPEVAYTIEQSKAAICFAHPDLVLFYGHPAVLEVAVIGSPDPLPARGEQAVAFIRLREGIVATESQLRAFASQRLADFKVPSKIVFSEGLP